jgi:CheY-like chemotaxis protein
MAFQTNPSAMLNVLVVDEDEAAATVLADLIQVAGCRTAVAFGPAMAVRVARLCLPMLLLLDLKALGSGAQDVVRALRGIRGLAPQALFVGMDDKATPVR